MFIKYLSLKLMTPTQILQDAIDTLGKSAMLYDLAKRWYCSFKCSGKSFEYEHTGGAFTTVTTRENFGIVKAKS